MGFCCRWKATAIGANHQSAENILKQNYKDDITLEEAVKLVVKVPEDNVNVIARISTDGRLQRLCSSANAPPCLRDLPQACGACRLEAPYLRCIGRPDSRIVDYSRI